MIEENSTSKQPYLDNEYLLVFEQFFNDSVEVYCKNEIIFSDFLKTNPKYGATGIEFRLPKHCVEYSDGVIMKIGKSKYKMEIISGFSLYYIGKNTQKKITAYYTNTERYYY